MDDMDFALVSKVGRVVNQHVRAGTAIERAWPDVVQSAERGIGATIARAALRLPLTQSLATVVAEFSGLLARDKPDAKINGLWFGLVELVADRTGRTLWCPYIAGSKRFERGNPDWPVSPAWMASDCYAQNEAMNQLSDLRRRHKSRHWLIETALIEPLHSLFVGRVVRDIPSWVLLGKARSRGIGCGFDEGDLNTIGLVNKRGFRPFRIK